VLRLEQLPVASHLSDPKVDSGSRQCFILHLGGTPMVYEWNEVRARRARLIKMASMLALTASAISVPVVLLLTASPL
jgi:hypothetical protein